MNFTNDIGVYISQTVKIKYDGRTLSLKDLNPRILITVLGMLRDMAQVWGKFLFEHFTFTFWRVSSNIYMILIPKLSIILSMFSIKLSRLVSNLNVLFL